MSFTKQGGFNYFYPNRTTSNFTPLRESDKADSYTIGNETFYVNYARTVAAGGSQTIYSDQKVDIAIMPLSDGLDENGGYLLISGGVPFVYESIDKNSAISDYDSDALRALIAFNFLSTDLITNADTITLDGVEYTFDTSTSSQSAGTVIAVGDGQGIGSSNLIGQINLLSSFINNYVAGWSSTLSTSNQTILSLKASANDNSKDSSQFSLGFVNQKVVVSHGIETGTAGIYNPKPWSRPWLLKNCFIASEKVMYGLSSVVSSSVSVTEYTINSNTNLYKSSFSLQLMPDTAQNYGVYWKNGEDVNARIRFNEDTQTYRGEYFEFE
jgi:hypothetical protein